LEAQAGIELTPQKWRVLRLLAQGFSNREISERLGMSRLVCKNHIVVILERTGMGTRLELALWYWEKCEEVVEMLAPPSLGDRVPALQAVLNY
jgi:DNA-binding NarL/FixJ family response regulator